MKQILVVILSLLSIFVVKAQEYENIQVSLLTVKPRSNEVYTVFGHTALRLVNLNTKEDIVFNWGTFNFRAPNFLYRFVKGETDYYLDTNDFPSFCIHYSMDNSTVVEQVLSLSGEEKATLMKLLADNLKPENKEYRYNYVFDNCTTRVRDLIQIACKNEINYQPIQTQSTFRNLIHSCTDPYPWLTFGIDLVVGSGADSLLHLQQELFLPEKLMDALEGAWVVNDAGERESIVGFTQTIMETEGEELQSKSFWSSPMAIGILLFIVYLTIVLIAYKKKRSFSFLFALLFLTAGLAGCIIAFMGLFSVHPCVWPNWNILWLHPLHFIAVIGYCFKKPHKLFYGYHIVNCTLLCMLLLAWFLIPQQMNPANIPYILSLAIASGYTVTVLNNNNI